jgi:hypothetical protein
MSKIFGLKRGEVAGSWRELYNEEPHCVCVRVCVCTNMYENVKADMVFVSCSMKSRTKFTKCRRRTVEYKHKYI